MNPSHSGSLQRRSFLTRGAWLSAATLAAAAGGSRSALAEFSRAFGPIDRDAITAGDIAMLKFLAAAELVEADLWQQYCELAVGNRAYARALRRIDRSLVRYVCDDRDDELSHAAFINSFLVAIGETPVDLDAFRTLPSVDATGAMPQGRLTNLTRLTVDTSWYLRYRSAANPDFGAAFPQLVEIRNRPTIPTADVPAAAMQGIAHSAAFHFAAIEQGGSSLYCSLIPKATSLAVLRVLTAIGPTEVYHFSAFHKSLEGLFAWRTRDGLEFPDLQANRDLAEAIFPEPARFLADGLALCSVIRPCDPAPAGPVAAATGLVQSGLFEGQSPQFFDAVVQLASAADAAERGTF
ncbi:MAG: ferritin-like domain-containing protein [Vicinamibacterales bacterium]